ncbi:MAG: hypothetical protein KTR31_03260 [Myxococcales bacterium]|nr:hypothetical protein [Myxococcales bacterium]
MIALALLAVIGCSRSIDCSDPATALVPASQGQPALTCGQSDEVLAYVELLAARRVAPGDRHLAHKELSERYTQDREATTDWMAKLREHGQALAVGRGLQGAAARAEAVWTAHTGSGPIQEPTAEDLWGVQRRALAVWSSDDEERLALTEADIEAWINYASLCREAQQGGVLRVSVADRVAVYRMVRERFDDGDRETQVALASMGPVWEQVRTAWQLASYEEQQVWVQAAPLPPPMTATSLGYAEALFTGDVVRHASVLQGALGPFRVGRPGATFDP